MNDNNLTLIIEPSEGDWVFRLISANSVSGIRLTTYRASVPISRLKEESKGALREVRRCVTKKSGLERLEGHARLLFELFFPRDLKALLRKASGHIAIHSPGITLPWSLLHDGDDYLIERWAFGELREFQGQEYQASNQVPSQGRFLIVADPAEDLPAARFEGESIVRATSALIDAGGCDLRLGRHRRSDLMRAFHRYDFLHFAGHADPDENGEVGWRMGDGHLAASDIASMSGRHAPRFVFANACRSDQESIVTALLTAGVRHFIGTRVDLPDLLGADLATRFYECLLAGDSIGQSLRKAALDAKSRHEPVWLAYRLLGDPAVSYFEDAPEEVLPTGKRSGAVLCARWPLESRELEAHAEEIDAWRRQMASVISKYGGRMLPSGQLIQRAIFGVPISFENDLFRSASAALELSQMNNGVGCIVNFGPVVMRQGDMIGPVIHMAEELCVSSARGAFITEQAAILLASAGIFSSVDQHGVRRIESLQSPTIGSAAALIGREQEVDSLVSFARDSVGRHSASGAVLIGTAGMGKSHIMHTVAGSIGSQYRVTWGRGVAYAESSPYAPFIQILSDLSGVSRTDGEGEARARLSSYLKSLESLQGSQSGAFTVIPIEDLLNEVVEEEALTDYLEPLLALLGFESGGGSALRHQQIPNAVGAVVRAEARRSPLAVFIDDVHWLPENGLRVVGELLESWSEGALFILCSARPGVVEPMDRWVARRHVQRVQLSPLNRRAAEELVRQSAGQLPPKLVTALISRAEGNPLFLRELALAGVSDGQESPPPTIEGVIQARLDREDSACRAFLRAGSIFGRVFWVDGVEKLLGKTRENHDILSVLERGRYIVRDEQSELPGMEQWRFAHGLLSEVVYQSIPDINRRAWHGRAGLWLEQEAPCLRAEDKARVGSHLARAGDLVRASRAWYESGLRALASAKPVLAQTAFEESLQLHQEETSDLNQTEIGSLYQYLAKGFLVRGDLLQADMMIEKSLDATSPSELLELSHRHRLRTEIFEANGLHDEAFEHVALAQAYATEAGGDEGHHLSLEIRRYGAWLSYRAGRLDEARTALEVLVDEMPPNAALLHGRVLNLLGVSAYGLGDYVMAESHLHAAKDLLGHVSNGDQFDAQRALAATYNNLGMLSMRQADRAAAVKWYELAVRVHAKTGNRASLARTYGNLGSLYGEMGDYARAEGFMREDIRIKSDTWKSEVATGYANLGKCLMLQNRHDEAESNLRRALKLIDAGRGPQFIGPDVWKSLAELLIQRTPQDLVEALQAAKHALALARDRGDQARESAALRTVGRVLAVQGSLKDAQKFAEEALVLARKLDLPLEIARCLHESAHLEFQAGVETYVETLAKAHAIFDERNVPRPKSFIHASPP